MSIRFFPSSSSSACSCSSTSSVTFSWPAGTASACSTFSLGFGPKILSFTRGDTEYCVASVPLGGYVKMAGENADRPTRRPPKPDELFAKTKWQRFQVYVAGPVMNMLTALVIMTGVYYHGAPEAAYEKNPAEVGHVVARSPAAAPTSARATSSSPSADERRRGPSSRRRCSRGQPRDRARGRPRGRRPHPARHARAAHAVRGRRHRRRPDVPSAD